MSSVLISSPEELLATPHAPSRPDLQRLTSLAWAVSSAPIAQMPIDAIVVNRNGHGETSVPASSAGAGNIDGLAASIMARGVLEPLIVTPEGRLIAGRRRLEAARRAGLAAVPVRVCEIADERAAIETSLVENVERADLDPLTRAQSYRGLIEQGATVDEIATLVGQGTGHVYQHLALLDLHPAVQEALHTNRLRFADARALAPLELEEQAVVLQQIRQSPKPLSSRQVKARVDAHRVMRLVQKPVPLQQQGDAGSLEGNYAFLFEAEDPAQNVTTTETPSKPLEELNGIIAEMVAAAQGEDPLRVWARKLSRILEQLHQMKHEKAAKEPDAPGAVQNQLL